MNDGSRVDAARWSVVSPLLDEVLALPAEARPAWLQALHERDTGLAAALRALLDEHRELVAAGYLEHGPARFDGNLAGQSAGAYTLLAPIGRGGMGTVWLAERSDGRFERRAAVKFLNVALGGGGELRFRREGRLLARLSHPNIAQLIDAGVSDHGAPFLVLEYVDGLPIDEYCEQRSLDIGSRVRLFLDVLGAVAHAHGNLVVHRDIKPSNVFVTVDGKVKLLDFGIARLIAGDDDSLADATRFTREGGVALTPAFAAPEQITGAPVSTATDVYALGALLFLLLAGRHPAGEQLRSPADLVKAIVETEPPRASDAAVKSKHAEARGLRGDLDTILAKALKKAPAERYASATAFAEDLRRHLAHVPISARPDTLAYRAGKFLRRNLLPVAAVSLTIAGLAAGLFVAERQRAIAEQERATAERERAIAERRFAEVRGLAGRLLELDSLVQRLPGSSAARQKIVDTSLEYLQRVAAEVHGDPTLALELGTAYLRVARVQGVPIGTNLGQPEEAEQNLRKAESLIAPVLTLQPDNRVAMLRLALVNHDLMGLAVARRPDGEALRLARDSAGWLEKFIATGPVEAADLSSFIAALINVANRLRGEGFPDDAIRLFAAGIEVLRTGPPNTHLGQLLSFRSLVYRDRGDLDSALDDAREAARILEPPPEGTDHGRALNFMSALMRQGQILGDDNGISLGRTEEALPPLRRAFELFDSRVHLDERDSNTRRMLATAGLQLADILRHIDAREALATYDHVRQHLGEIGTDSKLRRDEVRALSGSSYALRRLGRSAEVRERLDGAFSRLAQLELYPADRVELRTEPDEALRASADHEAAAGNLERAAEIYRELLAKALASGPKVQADLPDALSLSQIYASLATLEGRLGNANRAAELAALRLELWQGWAQRLPGNAFVARQLAQFPAK